MSTISNESERADGTELGNGMKTVAFSPISVSDHTVQPALFFVLFLTLFYLSNSS